EIALLANPNHPAVIRAVRPAAQRRIRLVSTNGAAGGPQNNYGSGRWPLSSEAATVRPINTTLRTLRDVEYKVLRGGPEGGPGNHRRVADAVLRPVTYAAREDRLEPRQVCPGEARIVGRPHRLESTLQDVGRQRTSCHEARKRK